MSLPYILEEKSVVRKENSTFTITEVIAQAKDWIEELQSATSLSNKYFYANVYDSESHQKYFVYTDAATEYFDLTNYVIEFINGNSQGTSSPTATIGLRYATVGWNNIYPTEGSFAPFMNNFYNATISSDQKVNSSTMLLKAGRTYKFDGGVEGITTNNGVIILALITYSDEAGTLDADNVIDSKAYESTVNNTYVRNYTINGYYTPSEDRYLKCYTSVNNLSNPTHLEFEMTVSEFIGNNINAVTNEAPGYSTDEVLTTERWINGKPLYKKVCNFTILDHDVVYDLNISDSEEMILKDYWVTTQDGRKFSGNTNWYESNLSENRALITADNNLFFYTPDGGDNWVNQPLVVIVEYTKTTDTAQSPVAQLTVQSDVYSEEETLTNKIWMGDSVYRKVINVALDNSNATGTWNTNFFDLSNLNIKNPIGSTLILSNQVQDSYQEMSNEPVWGQSYLVSPSAIKARFGTGYVGATASFILEYTKN